ncbi:MAG: TMEM165/GDT1 family protein [Corynebacteriales bacterium]|nr:TMEM165/GDT1 family protein [Mycobacteriales bacterium]
MSIDLAILATVFGLVFLLELPDKTMLATLVLSSRYRPAPVLVGVGVAFALQMAIAVAVGQALTLLPREITLSVVAVMFLIGAIILARESFKTEDEDEESTPVATAFWRIALISFGILFLAEFGDGSQLAAAGLSARYGAPLSVFLGAWLAEMAVCTLAALAGRALLRVVPVKWVQRIAAVIFTTFAVLAVVEIVRSTT